MPEIKFVSRMQTHFDETMKTKGLTRISYTSRFKLTVVACTLEKGNRAAAGQYQVDKKNLRRWRQNQAVLKEQRRDQRAARLRSPKLPGLEKAGTDAVDRRKAQGWNRCFDNTYRLKARPLAKEKKISE